MEARRMRIGRLTRTEGPVEQGLPFTGPETTSPRRPGNVTSSDGAVRVEPKQSRRIPRKVWLAAVLVLLGVLLAAQNSTVVFPLMDSYAIVNQHTIAVKVGVAPCSWTRVTNVAETVTEVLVKVETLPCPQLGPGTAELALRDLTVSLAADLGTRVVEDATGQTVSLR